MMRLDSINWGLRSLRWLFSIKIIVLCSDQDIIMPGLYQPSLFSRYLDRTRRMQMHRSTRRITQMAMSGQGLGHSPRVLHIVSNWHENQPHGCHGWVNTKHPKIRCPSWGVCLGLILVIFRSSTAWFSSLKWVATPLFCRPEFLLLFPWCWSDCWHNQPGDHVAFIKLCSFLPVQNNCQSCLNSTCSMKRCQIHCISSNIH